MKRRDFLKTTGVGLAALVSFLILGTTLSTQAWADDERLSFNFTAVSQAATIGRVQHRIILVGAGNFDAREVEGGGIFFHWDNASPVPQTIIATGTWKARRLVSFEPVGRYGRTFASVLEMLVDLFPDGGRRIRNVSLKVVCNVPQGGFLTGQPEGFTLTIPEAPFGPFRPLDPIAGITNIFTGGEAEDNE